MKLHLKLNLVIILLLSCISCADNKIALPNDLKVSNELLNKDLAITAPSVWNSFKKQDGSIVLEIKVKTNKQIITAPDFNAEIYLYENETKKWIEIENLTNYKTPPDNIILQPKDSMILPISPDLPITTSPEMILIIVRGSILENSVINNSQVGSYIILTLT